MRLPRPVAAWWRAHCPATHDDGGRLARIDERTHAVVNHLNTLDLPHRFHRLEALIMVAAVGRALDQTMTGPRVVTYDRDAILERAAETLSRHHKAVVSAARRVLDAVDNDSEAVLVPMTDLRNAVAALDRHLTELDSRLTETGTD